MTEDRPPWHNHRVNVWRSDTSCIEDNGSYVRIAARLAELTQGSLVIANARDQVDLEAGMQVSTLNTLAKPSISISR